MAAEGRGAAQLDRAHRAPLRTTESTGVALPVLRPAASGKRPMAVRPGA
jgi:hypothetical protein